MKKVLPIGNDQFRDVRERGAYYVDKTLMIRDFIDYGNIAALITRPRRFGKSLNMTMLRDFSILHRTVWSYLMGWPS